MRIHDETAYQILTEREVIERLVDTRGKRVLELGCGAAGMTRLLAEELGAAEVMATEVDRIQHEKNLLIPDLTAVTFRYGGAEAIADPDRCYDLVFLFKSWHHVPVPLMGQALAEIHRVLKPGGLAYFSEPVYWGPFNDVLRLVNDERVVRTVAFAALEEAVRSGAWELVAELFFQVPDRYDSWGAFEARFLRITHTPLHIDQARYAEIRDAFMAHMTPEGAYFLKPHRVDLLRKANVP